MHLKRQGCCKVQRYKYGSFDKILNEDEKIQRITKLDYRKAIGPIIIELFTRKWDNLEILMKVSTFLITLKAFFFSFS